MGTVSSVRVKAVGKSKEHHLVSRDATNSRTLKSEPYDCVELDFGDDVMFNCAEWKSSEGGLFTFNRELKS